MSDSTNIAIILVALVYWCAWWRVTYIEGVEYVFPIARLIRG